MALRSDRFVVGQPYPVVFDAILRALPAAGFDITEHDASRGLVRAATRRERVWIFVGAVDGITTEWVADVEQKLGLLRDRNQRRISEISAALDQYLTTYYG